MSFWTSSAFFLNSGDNEAGIFATRLSNRCTGAISLFKARQMKGISILSGYNKLETRIVGNERSCKAGLRLFKMRGNPGGDGEPSTLTGTNPKTQLAMGRASGFRNDQIVRVGTATSRTKAYSTHTCCLGERASKAMVNTQPMARS